MAAAATERAFGSDYYQERQIISEESNRSNTKDSLFPPENDYGSGKGSSGRSGSRKGKAPRSKSPRASPMRDRPERIPKRQPRGLSATYHVITTLILKLLNTSYVGDIFYSPNSDLFVIKNFLFI